MQKSIRSNNKKISPHTNQESYEATSQKMERLELQRLKLRQEQKFIDKNVKWIFELAISLLISYDQSFVSKYTIIYKSYMILTAFVLTVVGNYLYVDKFIGSQMSPEGNEGILTDKFSLQNWLHIATYILPLKGKFSLLFFQLMLLTTIQIIYETIIQLHFRIKTFFYHKYKTHQQQEQQNNKQKTEYLKKFDLLSKYMKAKKQQQGQCEKYKEQQRRMNKNSSEQEEKLFTKFDDILVSIKFFIQNFKVKNGLRLLFDTKFLYLFALFYSQNILWQGIVVKKWKPKTVHLFIIGCCIVEFLIWSIINVVLEASQNLQFGDKQFIELGPNCQISLGMY